MGDLITLIAQDAASVVATYLSAPPRFPLPSSGPPKLAAFIWEAASRAADDPDDLVPPAATTTDNRRAGAAAPRAPRPAVPTTTFPTESP